MASLLEFQGLKKVHPNGEAPYLFQNISAVVREPAVIAVLGASGQGKSTLLRILGMLDRPDEGRLLLQGKEAGQWRPRDWRMQASYVAQQPWMLPGSVEDNLHTVSRLHGQPFDRTLAARLMERAGLAGTSWSKSAGELSGGEKQRLALVRSLLLRPAVLLLDEVTSSLDAQNRRAVDALLGEWHSKEGVTMIRVTHEQEQARSVSRRVWFLARGTLLADEPTERFFTSPQSQEAREYLSVAASAAPAAEPVGGRR